MGLIDKYIHELQKHLPARKREKIGKEMRLMIERKLPEEFDAQDVKSILNEIGNPAKVAAQFGNRPMQLIGPRFYEMYSALLKMIVPLALVITVISVLGDYGMAGFQKSGNAGFVQMVLFEGWVRLFSIAMLGFCGLTILLAMLERVVPIKSLEPEIEKLQEWTSNELENTQMISVKKQISKWHIFGRLLWTASWVMVYFYADKLFGVYELANGKLNFVMPALNPDVLNVLWIPIMLMVTMEAALCMYKLFEGQWTKKVAYLQVGYELITKAIAIFIVTRSLFFQPAFLTYMGNIFNTTTDQFRNSFIFWFIVVSAVVSILTVYDAWKKAQMATRTAYPVNERVKFIKNRGSL